MSAARDIAPIGLALLIVLLMPTGVGLLLAVAVGIACSMTMHS